MPLPYSIGSFEFQRLTGNEPGFQRRHIEIFTKAGADGAAAIDMGAFGEPFEIESEAVVSALADAHDLAKAYNDAIGLTPLVLVYDAINFFTAYGTKYIVQQCTPGSPQAASIYYSRDNTVFAPGFIVRARWVLQPIVP